MQMSFVSQHQGSQGKFNLDFFKTVLITVNQPRLERAESHSWTHTVIQSYHYQSHNDSINIHVLQM